MFGLTTNRRLNAEVAAAKAETARVRNERDAAVEDANAYKASAETGARQYVDVDEKFTAVSMVNARLTEDLADVRAQLAASLRAEEGLARQIQAMSEPVEPSDAYMDDLNRVIGERDAQKERADLLEAALPVASSAEIEAWDRRVKVRNAWTQPTDPDKKPMEGGSGRPTHPATELRQALERCQALQARLDAYGKRAAS